MCKLTKRMYIHGHLIELELVYNNKHVETIALIYKYCHFLVAEGEASPSALLRDTTGGYLSSVAELRAPSPETAAHYLDVAIAARSSHARIQGQSVQHATPSPGSATLLYTLHIYQYAVDKSGKGGGECSYSC